MTNLVDEIEGQHHGVITMKNDNTFAIKFPKNLVAHGRSKHIETRFHYLMEHVSNGRLCLELGVTNRHARPVKK